MSTSVNSEVGVDPATSYAKLAELIRSKEAIIGVVGLGYVGLPLVRAFTAAGFRCMGFDIDHTKVEKLTRGESYIRHIDSAGLARLVREERFEPTSEMSRLGEAAIRT